MVMPKTKKTKTKKTEESRVKETKSLKTIPIGVKIISVLHYIASIIFIILGLFMIIFSGIMVSAINSPEMSEIYSAYEFDVTSILTQGFFIGVGVFFSALAFLVFFVGRGLWKLKPWARITAIIMSVLMILYEVYSIIVAFTFMQIIWLAIYIAIAVYLIFNKEVKKAFK
jgi:magnesium-transporting ATPase (P-type)